MHESASHLSISELRRYSDRVSAGKTTLARSFEVPRTHYFDLEDPIDLARLENARDVLGGLEGLVVIDEFQRQPGLFPILRVLADRPNRPARFLILGSASPDLVKGASESSLAGFISSKWRGWIARRSASPRATSSGFAAAFRTRISR